MSKLAKHSELTFQQIVESAPNALILVDKEGKIVFINGQTEKLFGHSKNELIGQSIEMLIPPRFQERHPQFRNMFFASPQARNLGVGRELFALRKNGTEFPVEISLNPLVIENKPLVLTSVIDITEKKKSEMAAFAHLEASERRYRTLVEEASSGIFILNSQGIILEVNAQAEQIHRRAKHEIIGHHFNEFIAKENQELALKELQKLLVSRKIHLEEIPFFRGDNSIGILEVSASLIKTGEEDLILSVVDDVTERNQMRRQALLQDRLVTTGTLAVGVAHEINNPAAYVYSNLYYLQKQLKVLQQANNNKKINSAEILHELQEVVTQSIGGVERIRDIVSSLKGFTRIDEEQIKGVNLHRVIDDAINVVFHEIKYKARLEKDYAIDIPEFAGNSGKLQQVFTNILLNAAQAIEPNKIEQNRIIIKTYRKNGHIGIDIKDTGQGMSAAILSRIFIPFFTTKAVGKGTGVGLSICYDIVRGHQGEIQVHSEEGKGTTMTILLPCREVASPVIEDTRAIPLQASKSLKILIVDDELYLLRALERMLKSEHTVTTTTEATHALALLEKDQSQFDVIVTDLLMPEMTGMELYAQILKKYPSFVKRVVFMTGGSFTPQAKDFLKTVDNPRIEKPFHIDELLKILNSVVK